MLNTYSDINTAWRENPGPYKHLAISNGEYNFGNNNVCGVCDLACRSANGKLLTLLDEGNPVGTFCTFGEDQSLEGYHRNMQYPIKVLPGVSSDLLPNFSCPKDL